MNIESGKNYITRNLDVRTLVSTNLSQSILLTKTKQYDVYRLYPDGSCYGINRESSKDHLCKIDTDPRSSKDEYFISTLFQIMDYQKDLIADTATNINKGHDKDFEILLDDAKENSVLLDHYNDGYKDNIVIISCYNDYKIKILDKIQRLHEAVDWWTI